MRATSLSALLVTTAISTLAAQRATTPAPPRAPGTRVATTVECAANLGIGVKSRRAFCDAIVSRVPRESVAVTIPTHTGTAALLFDLHNRFSVPLVPGQTLLAFAHHEAVVTVIRPTGDPIGRAAVIREFRSVADLFDQIGGGGRPGGVRAVAPGPPEAVRVIVPAGVNTVGIVGVRLRVRSGTGADDVFETPGRPVAVVSNVRVEYRPR